MRHLLTAAACVGALAAFSSAAVMEVEPNNTTGTANFIPASLYPTGGVAIDGALVPGDVDFFSFSFNSGDFVTVSVFDFTPGLPFDNDSVIGVFGPSGLVDEDDDDGPGLLSSLAFLVPTTGTYYVAVSGFGDLSTQTNGNYTGNHTENFAYKLVVGHNPAIPEPATLAALAGLSVLGLRRRA